MRVQEGTTWAGYSYAIQVDQAKSSLAPGTATVCAVSKVTWTNMANDQHEWLRTHVRGPTSLPLEKQPTTCQLPLQR